MDRKAQIFAPTKNVGGVRKPAKSSSPSTASNSTALKNVLSSMKGDIDSTLLKSFSYKTGDDIVKVETPKIQSIRKARKHVCFLVTGNPVIIDQKDTLKNMPKDFEKLIENIGKENGNGEATD